MARPTKFKPEFVEHKAFSDALKGVGEATPHRRKGERPEFRESAKQGGAGPHQPMMARRTYDAFGRPIGPPELLSRDERVERRGLDAYPVSEFMIGYVDASGKSSNRRCS